MSGATAPAVRRTRGARRRAGRLAVLLGFVIAAATLPQSASAAWIDRVEAASQTKTNLAAANYQYFSLGSGGLVLMPGPDGFTGLKPASAPYAPGIFHEYWWDSNTRRTEPFKLTSGYTSGGTFSPLEAAHVSSMEQTLHLEHGSLTSHLGLNTCGSADCRTTDRTSFVTPDGVLVVRIEDSDTKTFSLKVSTPISATIDFTSPSADQLVATAQSGGVHGPWALAVRAEGTGVSVDTATGLVSGTVGPSTPLTLYIAGAGIKTPTPATLAQDASDDAAAVGYSASRTATTNRWQDFWSRSSIALPDTRIERWYIRSAFIQAAYMINTEIPTGMVGFRAQNYFGGQGLEYDLPFNFMAMLNANHPDITKDVADWIEWTLPAAEAHAQYYNETGTPPNGTSAPYGAKWPWITSWDGKETNWKGNHQTSTNTYDKEAFPSINAVRMVLQQALYTNDPTRLAGAKQIMSKVAQYQMNNAEYGDPEGDGGPDELYNLGFFYQWPPRKLMVTPGAITEQANLLWLMRRMRDLGVLGPNGEDWGGMYANSVFMPTGYDATQQADVIVGYPTAPSGIAYAVSPFRLPFYWTNTIAPDDPLGQPTVQMTSSANDINYTFNLGWAALNAADLNQGDDALSRLNMMLDQNDVTNPAGAKVLFDDTNFNEASWTPASTTPEVAANATLMLGVQQLLMAGMDDDTIKVFPALPSEWQTTGVSFDDLLANGGLRVSGSYGATEVSATVENPSGGAQTRTLLVRMPRAAVGVTETHGETIQELRDGFARVRVTVPANGSKTITLQPSTSGTWTTVDDPALSYTGAWSTTSIPAGYYNGTGHYSASAGRTASYTFRGTAVRILGERTAASGQMRVAIDGVPYGLRDSYAVVRGTQKPLFEAYGLVPGRHTITITVPSVRSQYSAGAWVAIDALQYLETELDAYDVPAADASVTYAGSWTTSGTKRRSSSAGATATYTFSGRGLRVNAATGPDRGRMTVAVDGGLPVDVDTYSYSPRTSHPVWQSNELASGSHTVTITVSGDRGTDSTGDLVELVSLQPVTTLPAPPDASCTDLGGTVRVSSNVNPATYPAWAAPNVFDGQTTSVSASLGWHSQLGVTSPTAGECVAVDLGSTRTVNSVTLYPASPSGYPYGFGFPVDYRIEVSNRWNFADATTVASVTSAPLPSAPVTATLTTPTLARYVRMVATKTRAISTGQYAVALAEIGGN